MIPFRLAVFDMAGTTVTDRNEVRSIFIQAGQNTGLEFTPEQYQPLRGLSKREVFVRLWTNQSRHQSIDLPSRIEASFAEFRRILEEYYRTVPVVPTEGCLECFGWLRRQGISIGLTTGFYREVTNIILRRLEWDQGLDSRYVGTPDTFIQASVTSDEVANGRPAPDMIRRIMAATGIEDPRNVIKIGDTPVDLEEGRNAGCGLTLAVTNGSNTIEQLQGCSNDGLLSSLLELKECLQENSAERHRVLGK